MYAERVDRNLVLEKTWKYLLINFDKFNEANKLKIALALCTRDMPTSLQHSGEIKGVSPHVLVIVKDNSGAASESGTPNNRVSSYTTTDFSVQPAE